MRSGVFGMSKPLMIIMVVACLVLAVVVFFLFGNEEQSGYSQFEGVSILVKCSNPECNAEYQMDKKEFREAVSAEKQKNLLYIGDPPIRCKECGQMSLLEAIKCPKCETVFFKGQLGPGHFKDECPNCGYSETKEQRKKTAGGSS